MGMTAKQQAFINEYLIDFNGTQAAIRAGYSERSARQIGQQLLSKHDILAAIKARVSEMAMGADETLIKLGELARGDMRFFYKLSERWTEEPLPTEEVIEEEEYTDPLLGIKRKRYLVKKVVIDTEKLIDPRFSYLIDEFADSPRDGMSIKITKRLSVLQTIAKIHNLDTDGLQVDSAEDHKITVPAELLGSKFIDVHRDILAGRHMEYLLKGGRGSTKSSFTSLEFIALLVNHPAVHGLALRQVANTLRDSVYSQLVWAINELGLTDSFKCITSPLEITYLPTGQKIYFRGADAPEKIKSIKPTFGHIGIVWFEELDQFKGPEAIRKIEQSVLRGGEEAWEFKTYNPPPTAANWVNKYALVPKANQYQHSSTFLDVPKEWLGQTFVDEAEHLKSVNERAYNHEYLGEVTGTGGMVFENLKIRKITDEEISQFDRVLHGIDWGFYPDPAHYGRCHYDAARHTLYLFAEVRKWKHNNRQMYDAIKAAGYNDADLLIADSAEPKSVADFKSYGANCRGAEKGPESVKYSMKWLQGLTAIVIDPERAPYSAEEFSVYEYEQDPDGNYISEFPDKDNHAIDETRYATNLIWRRRGQ